MVADQVWHIELETYLTNLHDAAEKYRKWLYNRSSELDKKLDYPKKKLAKISKPIHEAYDLCFDLYDSQTESKDEAKEEKKSETEIEAEGEISVDDEVESEDEISLDDDEIEISASVENSEASEPDILAHESESQNDTSEVPLKKDVGSALNDATDALQTELENKTEI